MSEHKSEPSNRFLDALRQKPLLLDAAMGTRLIARGLDLDRDDPCLWNLDRPDEVLNIHRLDLDAGADAILTNTFGANRNRLSRFGRERNVEPINRAAVSLARAAAGPDRFVIGCLGPTAHQARHDSGEQAAILVDAGVDALLFETHDLDEALRGLAQSRHRRQLPRIVSLRVEGPPDADAARTLLRQGATALGTNCLPGVGSTVRWLERLRTLVDAPLLAKPSAGLPGQPLEGPASFAAAVPHLISLGVRLLGGCCGTTEGHLAALRAAIDQACS